MKTIVDQKYFNINSETRVKCDASKKELSACLEQKRNNIWYPIAYASRFLKKRTEI